MPRPLRERRPRCDSVRRDGFGGLRAASKETRTTSFSAGRQQVLDRVRARPETSVLIVGGGVNGAGLFREIALQGVDALLIDKSDFCAGASAASSRMIHGGLRYLEFGEFKLVRESLRERNLLLRNAPHGVAPLRTTIPIFSRFSGVLSCVRRFLGLGGERPPNRGALMVKVGLTFYDFFTRKDRLTPRHRFLSRAELLARRPHLNPNVIGAAVYYDAWITYPERLCLELLMDGEALCPEARAVNYVSLAGVEGDSVSLRDEATGRVFQVRPRIVVNAAGAWVDIANRALGRETAFIGGTKGAHLVIDNEDLLESTQGEMVYYENPDGRVAIVFPWLGKVLAGSTDIPIDDPDQARCEEEEVDYILESVHRIFPGVAVERSQIVSRFSGVRPLPRSDAAQPGQVSRDHECRVTEPTDEVPFPVYSLIGGKWTTFRAFAEQVADRVLERLGRERRASSEGLAIGGGKDFHRTDEARGEWLARLRQETGLAEARLSTLLERYGSRAEEMAAFCADGPDSALRHHAGYSAREIEWVVRCERALHLDDLVLRRTAMALLGELTHDLAEELASIMADVHSWSPERTRDEVRRAAELLRDRCGIDLAPQAARQDDRGRPPTKT